MTVWILFRNDSPVAAYRTEKEAETLRAGLHKPDAGIDEGIWHVKEVPFVAGCDCGRELTPVWWCPARCDDDEQL